MIDMTRTIIKVI